MVLQFMSIVTLLNVWPAGVPTLPLKCALQNWGYTDYQSVWKKKCNTIPLFTWGGLQVRDQFIVNYFKVIFLISMYAVFIIKKIQLIRPIWFFPDCPRTGTFPIIKQIIVRTFVRSYFLRGWYTMTKWYATSLYCDRLKAERFADVKAAKVQCVHQALAPY